MSGCLLSIFLGDILGPIMKFTTPYMNARLCPCPRQPARVECLPCCQMVDAASQFTASLFTIYYKDHDYCCFKESLYFVIIKYF